MVDYVPLVSLVGPYQGTASVQQAISFLVGDFKGVAGGLHVVIWSGTAKVRAHSAAFF